LLNLFFFYFESAVKIFKIKKKIFVGEDCCECLEKIVAKFFV
jgi:hypothetical protein